MSTNTTSTSDRLEADSLTSSSAQKQGAQNAERVSPFAAALPDLAVIARLANNFFAAMPGASAPLDARVSPASPNEADPRFVSGAVPRTVVPDYPREILSSPAAPNSGSVPRVPQMSSDRK